MQIKLQFDTNFDKNEDILQVITKLLGKENVEIKKATTINEARKSLRTLAKLGKIELAQNLVNKHCGGSIEKAPEESYKKLIKEIENIINEGEQEWRKQRL